MPEITFLPLRLRAAIASLMYAAMVTLMTMGYGSQPFWVDIVDCIMAGMLTIALVGQAREGTDIANEDDERPHLKHSERIGWFIRYAVLTIVLVGLMIFQAQNIPAVK